ncbi:transcription factor bHLH120-like [Olea europaea var. sylvestris]|uniref:transcription factor bHLH120-like n=1 Tax=Olea europaea var. sylvestris TaxID=158386 RepID=UPI000C1D4123|nr:transcription factor bHLH120-like [Olea europaea var. sylvestris]
MHRDLERQRRQEMAHLYASLRSIVPVEYLKGKKIISDHMQGTINYITDMQENIIQLRLQRDKPKKLSNSGNLSDEDGSSTSFSHSSVTVNPCRDGAEILIGSSLKEEGFPLSRVLVELLERGLNVISYVSTKANEMSLHIIQCEASDIRCNDLSELTGRLTEVINLRRDNP